MPTLRLEYVDPEQLDAHPSNWRRHPPRQQQALAAVIEEVGWAGALLFNERTGRLLDGHARRALFAGRGPVPVLVGAWTEQEERIILASLDPLAAMAETDRVALDALLKSTEAESEALNTMLADLADLHGLILTADSLAPVLDDDQDEAGEPGPDEAIDDCSIFGFREDARFPSTNAWDIPDLRPDRLCSDVPTATWDGTPIESGKGLLFLHGKHKIPREAAGGILAFYVDDDKFESVWTEAVKTVARLFAQGWAGVVAPDFSVWRDDPVPLQMWNVYRSRWVCRYWQEAGVPVIPSLNWSDERSYEWAFAGLPIEAPVVSCQCRTTKSRKGKGYFLRGLVEGLKQLRPQSVLLYGGPEHRDWSEPSLPSGPVYHWLPSWTQVFRRRKQKESAT